MTTRNEIQSKFNYYSSKVDIHDELFRKARNNGDVKEQRRQEKLLNEVWQQYIKYRNYYERGSN